MNCASRVAARSAIARERSARQPGVPVGLENSHRRCDENISPYHGAHSYEYFSLEHEVTSAVRELAASGEQAIQAAGDGDRCADTGATAEVTGAGQAPDTAYDGRANTECSTSVQRGNRVEERCRTKPRT
ncbi:hypothetical protein IFM47457_10759 [Aspergillus lentulus]|nr:hypothetical protein IFM47457_10759 [Aspergillus lentulus]